MRSFNCEKCDSNLTLGSALKQIYFFNYLNVYTEKLYEPNSTYLITQYMHLIFVFDHFIHSGPNDVMYVSKVSLFSLKGQ